MPKLTHKQAVLRLLSDRQPHSHIEVYRLGCVAHSRISDLRKDGHLISQWRDGDLYFYRLETADPLPVVSPSTPPNPPQFASPHEGRDEGVLTLFEEVA